MTFLLSIIILYAPEVGIKTMFFLCFLFGFFGCGYSLSYTFVGKMMPIKVKGTSIGLLNMLCILIGAPILQPLIGFILKTRSSLTQVVSLQDYEVALMCIPISLFIAFIMSLFIKEPKYELIN